MAVTRARQRLVMSGLARQDKQGNWQGSGDSPLAWLREHYRLDLPPAGSAVSWPEPEMQVELLTAVQPQTGETASPPALPAAWDFHPEAAPYQVSFPSGLAAPPDETATRPETESADDGDAARLRGVIMHRALQTLARGNPLPDAVSLAAALRQEGLPARRPPPWPRKFRRNSRPARRTRSWPSLPGPGYPRGGQRVAPGRPTPAGRHPPGGHRPSVLRRPRLVAPGLQDLPPRPGGGLGSLHHPGDREIPAPTPGLPGDGGRRPRGLTPPEAIRLGVYFTACRKVVEV